jgi:hypothetical protein
MTSFNVDASLFRVATMFQAGSGAIRYFLNGVHIEAHPEEGVLLVATDGHRMFVVHDKSGSVDGGPVIVKLRKAARKACRGHFKDGSDKCRLVATDASVPVAIQSERGVAFLQPEWLVEGQFPDWKAVLQKIHPDGHLACVNARLLRTFAKAGEALCDNALVEVSHVNAGGAALIRFKDDRAFGVLMQAKWTEGPAGWPDFLGFEPTAPAQPTPEAA